jgi:methyl-accepting chemotaxis protein
MRSTEAAKSTQDLISNSTERIKEATSIYGQVSEVMDKNSRIARKVTELIGEIAAASQEQAHGIAQVNIAVTEMDKVTQQTAANAEESASASEELSAQAEQLKAFVEDLIAVISGRNGSAASGPYSSAEGYGGKTFSTAIPAGKPAKTKALQLITAGSVKSRGTRS